MEKIKISQERIGEMLVFSEMLLYSSFPILISYTTKKMPPLLFAGLSILLAGLILFIYLLATGKLSKLLNKKALFYALAVTVFIIIIPSIFIYIGTSKTTGINTSLLLQMEIIFTLLLYGLCGYEKVTVNKLLGAFFVFLGGISILYNGQASINPGDLLIIAGTFFYPIGNYYAKKALELTTPAMIIFIRSIVGGAVLLIFSLSFEKSGPLFFDAISTHFIYIFLSGFLIYCVSKLFWYEGIKRLEIGKAIILSVGGYPAVSLFFAYVFLGEVPSRYQWLGFIFIIFGLFFTIYRMKKKQTIIEPI